MEKLIDLSNSITDQLNGLTKKQKLRLNVNEIEKSFRLIEGLIVFARLENFTPPLNRDFPTWEELKPELEIMFGKLKFFNNKRKAFRMVKIYKDEKKIFEYIKMKYPLLEIELQDKGLGRRDYFKGVILRFKNEN